MSSAVTPGIITALLAERDAQKALHKEKQEAAEHAKRESDRLDTESQGYEYDAQVAIANVRRLNAALTGLGARPDLMGSTE